MKLILGAGKTAQAGWRSTEQSELDMLRAENFSRIAPEGGITALLAEHVWEHLSPEEGRLAAKNCFDALEPGGYLRVAVPDKNFRNEWYQNMVKVGGNGDPSHPAYTHKVLYDAPTLRALFESVGFTVELLEYCDENGLFHYKPWDPEDGKIGRSLRFDTRNADGRLGMVSIILDARKPPAP